MPPITVSARSGEHIPAPHHYAELTAHMEPDRINPLPGNPELESLYLDYQGAVLDETYRGHPTYRRLDQLSAHQQDQIAAVAGRLVTMGVISPQLAQKRLERIRVITVEKHTRPNGQEVGGEYRNGLTVVASVVNGVPRSPEQQNHGLLHETSHGLAAINEIASFGTTVGDFGSGLRHRRHSGPDTISQLAAAEESIIDSSVVGISDLDAQAYLAGAYPDVGYWQEDLVLAKLAATHPDTWHNLWKAVFSAPIQSKQQGKDIAEAYVAAATGILPATYFTT